MTETLGPWFTLSEAVALGDKSRVTLKRWLYKGALPNAVKVDSEYGEHWSIPFQDLVASGIQMVGNDTGGVSDAVAQNIVVKLARAEAVAEERARHIDRLEQLLESYGKRQVEMLDRQHRLLARQVEILEAGLERERLELCVLLGGRVEDRELAVGPAAQRDSSVEQGPEER
jgi:hypothetical protein